MAVTQYKTLQDVIDTENRYDVNGVTIFTKTEDGDLIIRDTDLFTIYMRYIQPFITTYTVTKEQREHYARKPEWLSQDIYGTPELSWLLIMLNDMECASKFYLKSTVRAIPPDRACGKMVARKHLYHPHPKMGDQTMGRDSGGLRKEIIAI